MFLIVLLNIGVKVFTLLWCTGLDKRVQMQILEFALGKMVYSPGIIYKALGFSGVSFGIVSEVVILIK